MSSAAESSTAAVQITALTRLFGTFTAVDHVNLTIPEGMIFGLLGSNGAGKSTLIKMLTTLLPPTSGTALIAGCNLILEPRAVRRHIGYVPQLVSADGALTATENLLLSARIYGIARNERAQRIADALAFMQLEAFADTLVKNYSGGMVRRLEIAQALLHRPSVLFLDEPTVGLDPVARHVVWTRLQELRNQRHTTILLTTHDMEEAGTLCDKLAILHHGRVRVVGSPQELKTQLGPEATLEQVFVHYVGETIETGGRLHDVASIRRTTQRLQ